MTMNLTGDVGRDGRPEDVAIVQALLANIKGPDGRVFWDRRIDGRPGTELAAAIETFQRRRVEPAVADGSAERGVVWPGSRTWQALVSLFPPTWGELRLAPGNAVLLYASNDLRAAISDTVVRLRQRTSARERMIAHRLRIELTHAVESIAGATGVGLALVRTAFADDRVAMWFEPVGLSVLDDYGRPQAMDGRPGEVPVALWRVIDRMMTGRAAVEAIGKGGYRPRDGLPSLRSNPDTALFARYEISPSSIHGDKRPVLAALALIERIDRLSLAAHDELQQLFDIVASDDPSVAELLRQKRDMASRSATRQPEAVGAGPSPFEQAVDQLLRTIQRNYQSSHMAQLQNLTRDPLDLWEAYERFIDLVGDRGPWDIKREFPRWVRDHLEGVEYGSDLWGNLHYGYLGRAAGFTEDELTIGAHLQAIKATWRLDDRRDQAAIGLGFALWSEHRFPVPRGALLDALRQRRTELNTR